MRTCFCWCTATSTTVEDTTCNSLTMQHTGQTHNQSRCPPLRRVRGSQPQQEAKSVDAYQSLIRKIAVIPLVYCPVSLIAKWSISWELTLKFEVYEPVGEFEGDCFNLHIFLTQFFPREHKQVLRYLQVSSHFFLVDKKVRFSPFGFEVDLHPECLSWQLIESIYKTSSRRVSPFKLTQLFRNITLW